MLQGILLREVKKIPDEKGFFAELLREDWKDILGEDKIVQTKLSKSYPSVIRAWR